MVHDDVRDYYNKNGNNGNDEEEKWNVLFEQYKIAHPELSADFSRRMKGELPADWKNCLPSYSHLDTKAVATRNRCVISCHFCVMSYHFVWCYAVSHHFVLCCVLCHFVLCCVV